MAAAARLATGPCLGAGSPGWTLWTRANPHPFAYSAVVARGLRVALLVLTATSGRLNVGSAGYMLGDVLWPWLFTALIARANSSRWQWWLYVVVFIGIFLVVAFVAGLGALGRSGH
jgi:hypothetical protein